MGTMAEVQILRFVQDDNEREIREPLAAAESSPWRARLSPAEAATVVGWLLVMAIIAYSYLGGSAGGPYGTCYAESGRSVPCELVDR